MPSFTPTQGRYLSFILAYSEGFGLPPAESEIADALKVSPPSVNQMMKMLEKKGLIQRQVGVARSIEILIDRSEISCERYSRSTIAVTPPFACRWLNVLANIGRQRSLRVCLIFLRPMLDGCFRMTRPIATCSMKCWSNEIEPRTGYRVPRRGCNLAASTTSKRKVYTRSVGQPWGSLLARSASPRGTHSHRD